MLLVIFCNFRGFKGILAILDISMGILVILEVLGEFLVFLEVLEGFGLFFANFSNIFGHFSGFGIFLFILEVLGHFCHF